jgi:hypothetical protein
LEVTLDFVMKGTGFSPYVKAPLTLPYRA